MTMITNRVSANLSDNAQQTVIAAIATIRENLPFLVDLTSKERIALSKLGYRSQTFVRRASEVASQHSALLPQGFLEEMRRDADLYAILEPIQLAIDLLAKQIDDTRLQIGAEYYAAARTVYAISRTPFAEAPMRTAAQDLGKRFGRKVRTESVDEIVVPAKPPDPALNNF
jgi:hypothetical protein